MRFRSQKVGAAFASSLVAICGVSCSERVHFLDRSTPPPDSQQPSPVEMGGYGGAPTTVISEPIPELGGAGGAGPLQELNSDMLFDPDRLHRVELTMGTSERLKLAEQALSGESSRALMEIDGRQSNVPVAVRYEDGVLALEDCFEGAAFKLDEGGRAVCQKLSWKLDFSGLTPDEKPLDLHGVKLVGLLERGFFHHALATQIYLGMGVTAPRVSFTELYVNGQYLGLYLLEEPLDEDFLNNRLGTAGRSIENVWPLSTNSLDYDLSRTLPPRAKQEVIENFASLAGAISSASAGGDWASVTERLSVEEVLRYLVVDQALQNYTGVTHIEDGESHGYAWAQQATGGRFALIPLDSHDTFPGWNRMTEPLWSDASDLELGDCESTPTPAACDSLFSLLASRHWDEYTALGHKLLENVFTEDAVNARLKSWVTMLKDAGIADPYVDFPDVEDDAYELRTDEVLRLREDFLDHLN